MAAHREDTPGEDSYKITDELAKTMISLASSFGKDLLEKSGPEIAAEWYFKWDETRNIEQNIYEFSDILELHKRRWKKWEEHHNGHVCAVERVRDKYVMPRVREFLALLAAHQQKKHI